MQRVATHLEIKELREKSEIGKCFCEKVREIYEKRQNVNKRQIVCNTVSVYGDIVNAEYFEILSLAYVLFPKQMLSMTIV